MSSSISSGDSTPSSSVKSMFRERCWRIMIEYATSRLAKRRWCWRFKAMWPVRATLRRLLVIEPHTLRASHQRS